MQNPFGGKLRLMYRLKPGGYTILEVMLFIAISGLLLVSAMIVVGNKQAHTEFITSANDVNTKMRQWVNQVANGFTANPSSADSVTQYSCTLDAGGNPTLDVETSGDFERGTNPDCVFLGKAILVNTDDNNDQIYAYSVIGRRTYQSAGETVLVDSLATAQPVAAISGIPSDPDYINLTEEYNIPNGTVIKSVESSPFADSRMAGFFTSFSGTNAVNGAQSMLAVQYPMASDQEPQHTLPLNCIKLDGSCFGPGPLANPPSPMGEWVICLASTRNNESAKLILTSINGRGVNTRLEFTPC